MKTHLLIAALALPLLLAGCETAYVGRHPHRYGYVERETYYHRPYRRSAIVVESRPSYYRPYAPRTEVRYYNDSDGRYYYSGGRRVYVNAGVYY